MQLIIFQCVHSGATNKWVFDEMTTQFLAVLFLAKSSVKQCFLILCIYCIT